MNFTISAKGIDLIKSFEGCRLKAYQDSAGIWTIGYGHTKNVSPQMSITKEQASAYLAYDLKNAEAAVNSYVTAALSQNMFDALVSFTFNVGSGALKRSTLLIRLNCGDTKAAAAEFDRWVYAGKKKLSGLVKRRRAEKNLFCT